MKDESWNEWTTFSSLGEGPLTRKPPAFISPTGQDRENDNQAPYNFWNVIAPKLIEGKNTLTFEALGDCSLTEVVVASGTLELLVDKLTLGKLIAKNGGHLPPSNMRRAHRALKKVIVAEWPAGKLKDLSVVSNEWVIERDPVHGHPTRRTLDAWAVVQTETEGGCELFRLGLSQDANGRKFRGPGVLSMSNPRPYACK